MKPTLEEIKDNYERVLSRLHYGCGETIDWDWDINNPHNLKFKKGDVVVIDNAEKRSAYVRMLGKVGTIVDAEYTRYIDDERITKEILEYIDYAKLKGCSLTGTEDEKIEFINVVKR